MFNELGTLLRGFCSAAHFPIEAGNMEGTDKLLPDLMPFKLKYTPAAAREKVLELDQYLYVCIFRPD
jgi:hypothetical protein